MMYSDFVMDLQGTHLLHHLLLVVRYQAIFLPAEIQVWATTNMLTYLLNRPLLLMKVQLAVVRMHSLAVAQCPLL